MAKIWKQQQEQREKQQREAAEALRKQQAEKRAAEQKRQEEAARKYREQYVHVNLPKGSTRQAYTSTCRHDGWWPKIQGRTACPKCDEIWTYLLECPGCQMKACPRCQAAIRPRMPRNAAWTNRRAPPRVRSPSPDFDWD